jgi:hypothetical protein
VRRWRRKEVAEMLSLIETLTGFAAIMLMLSLLVKTLTSVIKNYLDYYSDNLKHEVQRLVLETTGKTWDSFLQNNDMSDQAKNIKNIVMDIHWERLGDEFLTPAYLSWFLKQLDPNARVFDLESRLKIHMANVKYTFEMRMKNLAMAVGLGLCLLCNINAFTIWKSLYTDQQLRATFADSYAKKATELADNQAKQTPQATPANGPTTSLNKSQADAQLKDFRQNMQGFLTDVSFGVGRIWREECLVLTDKLRQECQEKKTENTAKGAELKPAQEKKDAQSVPGILVYEFFGSLLTGILVSIGAPYWHDILQALSSLRSTPPAAKAKA